MRGIIVVQKEPWLDSKVYSGEICLINLTSRNQRPRNRNQKPVQENELSMVRTLDIGCWIHRIHLPSVG